MISPMKQLDLLLFHGEKEDFLTALRKVGVVHITETYENISAAAREIQGEMSSVKKLLSALPKTKGIDPVIEGEGAEVVEIAHALLEKRELTLGQKDSYGKEIETLTPWGEIDSSKIERLAEDSVYFNYYEVKTQQLSLLGDSVYEIISGNKSQSNVVVISETADAQIEHLEALVLPKKSLSKLKALVKKCDETITSLDAEIATISARRAVIEDYALTLQADFELESARESMSDSAEGHLLRLHGWLTAAESAAVTKVCDRFSCWYEIAEPTTDSVIPVQLHNRPTPKLFEPITKIFDLPDYFEIDPTPFFAPFYALFFGLCLGDLGYGFVLILISLFALLKGPQGLNGIAKLGFILGGATMASGFLLNTVFGAQVFATDPDAGYAFLSASSNGFALLKPVMINEIQVFPTMSFALYLGFTQITLGIALKAVNKFREGGFTHILYPIGSILLTLSAMMALIQINFLDMATFMAIVRGVPLEYVVEATTKLQESIPMDLVLYAVYMGLFLLFFFNNPDKKLGFRIPMGLWELYGFVTGLMGDVLSYIRLFALGLAGGLLGKAFNDIGFMIMTDGSPKWLIIVTIAILIVGHTINFSLAALGSFVHPLRLTFVEFYKNLEFKGGAPIFTPFRNKENK